MDATPAHVILGSEVRDLISRSLQAPDWFPMSQSLSAQYAQHTELINTGLDTALASVAAVLVFFGLPAMDMILGTDSRTPAQVTTTILGEGHCKLCKGKYENLWACKHAHLAQLAC